MKYLELFYYFIVVASLVIGGFCLYKYLTRCKHKHCSIFTIEGDDSPRLGCDECGKDFGYVSY